MTSFSLCKTAYKFQISSFLVRLIYFSCWTASKANFVQQRTTLKKDTDNENETDISFRETFGFNTQYTGWVNLIDPSFKKTGKKLRSYFKIIPILG